MEKRYSYWSIEVFYLIFCVLLLARPAVFLSNMDPRSNLLGAILEIIPCLILCYKHKISINYKLLYVFAGLAVWTILHFILDGDKKVLQYVQLYINLYIAYVLVRVFREDLFGYFWRVVTALTALDVVLWGVLHVVNVNTVVSMGLFEPASTTSSASFLLFNTPALDRYEGEGLYGLMRNCGFAWEPGLFGSIVVMALFFNLREYGYSLHKNIAAWILLLGVFSSFSTTAYSTIFVLILCRVWWATRERPTLYKFVSGLLLIPVIVTIVGLPFMQEKVLKEMDSDEYPSQNVEYLMQIDDSDGLITVQRFEGLWLDYQNFIHAPILGYGFNRENSYVYKEYSPILLTSNAITSVLAMWGIIYTIFIVFLFIQGSKWLRTSAPESKNSLFLVFISISVSYNLLTLPITLSMFLFPILNTRTGEEEDYQEENYLKFEEL